MAEYVILECRKLCKKILGEDFCNIDPLEASGSSRRYFRVETGEKTYIICYSDNVRENETFLKLSEYFGKCGLHVPTVLGVGDDRKIYILQDLGDTDLLTLINYDNISEDRKHDLQASPEVTDNNPERVIRKSLSELVRFQRLPYEGWKDLVEFEPLNRDLIRYDFNYCIENFIKLSGIEYDEYELFRDFCCLEEILLSFPGELWGLMYRDFQSRNIMIHHHQPYFIDYQSCRKGPCIYDLVSFAWQAKAGFTSGERKRIIDIYCEEMSNMGVACGQSVKENIGFWAAFRIIQTLGAYGLRGLKERKRHFIESIPLALDNLDELFQSYDLKSMFPTLAYIISKNQFNKKSQI